MAAEEKPAARGTIATVVATAAVTLAIGVTAAALGGYLVPASDQKTSPEPVAEPGPVETRPAAPSNAPSVVLVPVAQDPRGEPPVAVPAQPEPKVLLAANEPTEHGDEDDDDGRARKHHEREDEDDHDDD